MGVIFFVPFHTDPGAHSASYIMGTGSFPGKKRPGLKEEMSKLGMEIKIELNIWLHPPMNIGEMLGNYELEIKPLKRFRASNTGEISLETLTIITDA
jgi:hypothetical protein